MWEKLFLVTPVYILVALLVVVSNITDSSIKAQNVELAQSEVALAQTIQKFKSVQVEGLPTSLYIPRLNLSLGIAEGLYDIPSKTWTLSKNNAHFASQTNPVNNSQDGGLTLIYGHNTSKVFAVTNNLVAGDIIEITTDSNFIFTYEFLNQEVFFPDNVEIFEYTGKPRLSLLSCGGRWSENRRIMNFDLVSTRKVN